jgi:hypothetical protein
MIGTTRAVDVDTLRWVIFAVLLLPGSWVVILNWSVPFRKRSGSFIPLLGGVLVAVAFAVVPAERLNILWWLPLLFDLGSAPLLLLTGTYLVWRSLTRKADKSV